MEPEQIVDCPYKPGTEEHKTWIKSNVITKQLDNSTIAWNDAKAIADDRLLKLSAQYNTIATVKSLALEQLIASMPVAKQYAPILKSSIALMAEVNKIWEATLQGVAHPTLREIIFLPQIRHAPEWATKKQLLKILYNASAVDYKQLNRNLGYLEFVVYRPINWSILVSPNSASVKDMSYGLAAVEFRSYHIPD